jgi:hypothetical protein
MNYWEALPTPVSGRFYVPVTLQEWISPRGIVSQGDCEDRHPKVASAA